MQSNFGRVNTFMYLFLRYSESIVVVFLIEKILIQAKLHIVLHWLSFRNEKVLFTHGIFLFKFCLKYSENIKM